MSTYRVPVLEQFAWQEPVLEIANSPTVVTKGARYIVGPIPAGAFAGFAVGRVVWMDDAGWMVDIPSEGWKVYNQADTAFYVYKSGAWSSASVMDGLTLTGDVKSDLDEIDWDLLDHNAAALTFNTSADINMLNFDTTNEAEVLSTEATLRLDGDVDLSNNTGTDVALPVATDAVTFSVDSTSILTIDSANMAVKVDRDLTIEGNLLVKGATTTIETSQLVVEDKLITLNKGATGLAGAGDAGIEFDLDGAAVGYIKTSIDGNDFVLNAPVGDAVLTIDVDADSTLNMLGDLTVEAEGGTINQDLTTDSTTVEFAGLKLTGDLDLSAQITDIAVLANSATALTLDSGTVTLDTQTGDKKLLVTGTLGVTGTTKLTGDLAFTQASDIDIIDAADALSIDSASLAGIIAIDSTAGVEKVTMAGGLDVTGEVDLAAGLTVTNDITIGVASTITDGTATATVAEMETAYDTRGQWDADLGVMRFVDPDAYVAP